MNKKHILLIAISIIYLAGFNLVSAQTAEQVCVGKKNGDACTYTTSTNNSRGGGTSGGTQSGYCDRTNSDSEPAKNPLICKTGTDANDAGLFDCVVSGDVCVDGGKKGKCESSTSGTSVRNQTTTFTCNTSSTPDSSLTTPNSGLSTDTSPASTTAGTVSYESYTNFPGVGRISNLCQLITALWLLGFAVLLTSVLGMFLYGGYIYVTAGVNAGKVNQAKEIFTNTITGLIIGLSIFIIINVINPGLLQGNCSIPSVGSGSTIGGPAGPSNIVPKPGESVFPVTYLYQGPSGGQVYGAPRDGRIHAGIDFTPCWADTTPGGVPYTRAGWEAQPVLAFRDGTVNESTTGYLGVTHADGVRTRYVHNSRNLVRVGDSVKAGQEIARVGKIDTAVAHLHFEVYINGSPVNPANILLDSSRNPDPSKVKTTGSPRSGCGGL